MTNRKWISVGAFFALSSVAIGAFAAHALKATLSEYALGIIETGARYQMYHALGIVLVAIVSTQLKLKLSISKLCFSVGIVLFSGSLYLLAFSGLKTFAYFTPIGGIFFIVAWMILIYRLLRVDIGD
ncbi:DUF423 domain-containing protein [Agaribacter marinus]|uniref:DUF423 domain-containing protein n=1 Tax=Agaribacter marinus TaxID=1431249 RepID=A0AA37WJI0_9ALTE|nr:DUF423 domain-containing protein [Agaribacter marinus]GLR70234.1 hypothetical protein GCM10007852_11420 [Agaribacter marinus]